MKSKISFCRLVRSRSTIVGSIPSIAGSAAFEHLFVQASGPRGRVQALCGILTASAQSPCQAERPMPEPQEAPEGAPRRTHLAAERTQLAWWRTGLTAIAV